MTSLPDWVWYGQPGHFIAAQNCNYHLHTHVAEGRYCVSTVGEYLPSGAEEWQDLGGLGPGWPRGSMRYETMVFEIGDDGEPIDWGGIEQERYATREKAHEGHLRWCLDYESKVPA